MKNRTGKRPFASVIRFASIGAIAAAVGFLLVEEAPRWSDPSDPPELTSETRPLRPREASPLSKLARAAGPDAPERDLTEIAAEATRSIVSVSSTRMARGHSAMPGPFGGLPFPFGPPLGDREVKGLGSGVIVKASGVILTNHHVIEGARQVVVSLWNDREVSAEVVGSDPKTDLAVVRLEESVEGLVPLAMGDSTKLRPGELVLAIGNPFGIGQTVTLGIVSATGRSSMGIVDYEDFIQTDAAINPGNSGGGLINMSGELVGINTAILSRTGGYQGIGFAIPTQMAGPVMDALVETGRVSRGWLGVTIQDVDRDLAQALGIGAERGVLVAGVEPGSPAARGGLKRGDVVVGLGGRDVESGARLRSLVAETAPGTSVEVTVIRGDRRQELQVELGEQPDSTPSRPDQKAAGSLGLTLGPLTPEARRQLDVPDDVRHGVVVREVAPSSPAAVAGLRPGDVLLEIDRKPVRSPAEAAGRLRGVDRPVAVLTLRGGSTLFLAIKPQ